MTLRLRWKTKERQIQKPLDPNVYGSPVRLVTERYTILEYRDTATRGLIAANWEEVPIAGLNDA